MSQRGELGSRRSRGNFVSFDDPGSTQAGPSSYASAPVARSTSVLAPAMLATQGPPIPIITVTRPLDPYRPVSHDYRGTDTLMQAAWAATPPAKSFLEAIEQAKDIREKTYTIPNANLGRLAGAVTTQSAGPAARSLSSSRFTDSGQANQSFGPTLQSQSYAGIVSSGDGNQSSGLTVPSQSYSSTVSSRPPAPRFPPGLFSSPPTVAVPRPVVQRQSFRGNSQAYGLSSILEELEIIPPKSMPSPPLAFPGHGDQPVGLNVPSNGSHVMVSPPPRLPAVYSNFEGGVYGSPFASVNNIPRAGPTLPSESSSATLCSGRSSPHLGSNLFAPALRAAPGSLYDDEFVPPSLPTPPVVSSGRSISPHLGTGLSAPMDVNMASSLRLAAVLQSASHPYQQPPAYSQSGYHGPESESHNQAVGFGGQSSYQANHQLNYQAPPFDPRTTYEAPTQVSSQPNYQISHQAPPYDPRATYEPLNQLATQPTSQPIYQAGQFDPRATYGPPTQFALQPTYQTFPYEAAYQPAFQLRGRQSGRGRHYTYRPGVYEEQPSYKRFLLQSQPLQRGQRNGSNTGPPQNESARLLSPAPEQPSVRSGFADFPRNIPKSSPKDEIWSPEPKNRDAAVANLKKAQEAKNLADLRFGVRQTQLKNIDKKLQIETETEHVEGERYQQEEKTQRREIQRRGAKRSHRR